ncbi:MAG: nucleotide exchange factor GrpE [Eubacterium sp.]|nr:nucleotide exchange factor GrpE [Eubacterium sp.]
MGTIIGVHFWNRIARLCFCDAESVSVAEVNLPSDIKRLDIAANEYALKKAFEVIDEFLKEKAGISNYSLVIAISDDMGLKEIQGIYSAAREFGVNVVRTVTETLAMAYFSYVEYGLGGNALMAFVSPAKLGISEYYLEQGIVEKLDTYFAGRWNGSSLGKSEFIHSYSDKIFDATAADYVICSGTMERSLDFDFALKNYIKSSGTFINKNIELKAIDNQCVIEGIGFICGKLEGRTAFQGLAAIDSASPYELILSVNGEMYPLLDSETVVPIKKTIEINKFPEPVRSFNEIKLFEYRKKEFVLVSDIHVSKDKLEEFYKKASTVKIEVDDDKKLTLTFVDIQSRSEYVINVLEASAQDDALEEKEEDVPGFITKMLPIIDNLEYAANYAKDDDSPYTQGIVQSYNNAVEILKKNGVEIIHGEGEPFDYNFQTAVAHVTDVDLPDNIVKQVMQAGYVYKGKVLRPASVVVAN